MHTTHRTGALRTISLCLLVMLGMSTSSLFSIRMLGQDKEENKEENKEEEKSDPKAMLIFGDAANFQNKKLYDIAIEDWKRLLKEYPTDPLAKKGQFFLGFCQMRQKELGLAATAFQLTLTNYKPFEFTEEAYFLLGWCRYTIAGQQQGDEQVTLLGESIKSLTEGITKYPKGPFADDALYYRGEAQYKLGDREAAIASYKQLVDNYAKSNMRSSGLYALGVTHEELKRDDIASTIYDLFLEEFPEDSLASEIQLRKADTVLRGGKTEEAERLFAAMVAKRWADCAARSEDRQRAGAWRKVLRICTKRCARAT